MLFLEVQPGRGNLFTFPCIFAPNEFQFAPNETKFAQNETHYAVMNQMKLNLHKMKTYYAVMNQMKLNVHQMKLNLHQMKFHFHQIFYRLIGATLIGNFLMIPS